MAASTASACGDRRQAGGPACRSLGRRPAGSAVEARRAQLGGVRPQVRERHVAVTAVAPPGPSGAHDDVPPAGERVVTAVADDDDGVAVHQPRPLAVRWRHLHGVDPQDLGRVGGDLRRPPPVERHGTAGVECGQHPVELVVVATPTSTEPLDRLAGHRCVRPRRHEPIEVVEGVSPGIGGDVVARGPACGADRRSTTGAADGATSRGRTVSGYGSTCPRRVPRRPSSLLPPPPTDGLYATPRSWRTRFRPGSGGVQRSSSSMVDPHGNPWGSRSSSSRRAQYVR